MKDNTHMHTPFKFDLSKGMIVNQAYNWRVDILTVNHPVLPWIVLSVICTLVGKEN
jgi:hypothetical protein